MPPCGPCRWPRRTVSASCPLSSPSYQAAWTSIAGTVPCAARLNLPLAHEVLGRLSWRKNNGGGTVPCAAMLTVPRLASTRVNMTRTAGNASRAGSCASVASPSTSARALLASDSFFLHEITPCSAPRPRPPRLGCSVSILCSKGPSLGVGSKSAEPLAWKWVLRVRGQPMQHAFTRCSGHVDGSRCAMGAGCETARQPMQHAVLRVTLVCARLEAMP